MSDHLQKPMASMTAEELTALEQELGNRFEATRQQGLSLDLTRGKPAVAQLDISNPLDGILQGNYLAEDGSDVRNYGGLCGIPEARRLGGRLLDVDPKLVIAGGNSSLWLMYFTLETALNAGLVGGPWREAGPAKVLCPVPGYDRHFTICETLNLEMVNVPMTDSGPDMDFVETAVAKDPSIKAIWCIPKYHNPVGCIYSANTVERLAALPKSAGDGFVVLWDNAYAVHDFEFPPAPVENIMRHAAALGTEDHIVMFASTSKITYAGGGIAFIGASAATLSRLEKRLSIMLVGPDKVNQLRHVRLLEERLEQHMQNHAKLVKPKFEAIEKTLREELTGLDIAHWTTPKGGYFVSLDTTPGLASEVVGLAAEVGVKLTPAGATFPYGVDPDDTNVRLAPTFATQEEVEAAVSIVTLCVRLAAARHYLVAA